MRVSADGVEGCLIQTLGTSQYMFRTYNEDKTYKDYRLLHSELVVTINDPDAFFYKTPNGDLLLDHSPETLGFGRKN